MRFVVIDLVLTVATAAYGQSSPSNDNLGGILNALSQSASGEIYRQIADAIAGSSLLRSEMSKAAEANVLRGIEVAPNGTRGGMPPVFSAFTSDRKIIMTDEFLTALRNNRLFDVGQPEMLPNNTVFTLAHLLYHLNNPVDIRKFRNPEEAMKGGVGNEAAAFIYGWNIMLNAAERANNNQRLSTGQVGQLLMNFRYRAVFFGGINHKQAPLKFESSGEIKPNSNNINAIAIPLGNSRLYDIE